MSNSISDKIQVEETPLPGLLKFNLPIMEDERGSFQEKFQKEKLAALGLPKEFVVVQQNVSFNNKRGTTRGLHAEPWDKLVSLINGKAFAAFVDLRKENFGKMFICEITPNVAVFIPQGVANSFQTLEPNVYYSYLINSHWSPDVKYKFLNLADPDLNIAWPISLSDAIISEKDKNHPMMKDIQPF